MATEIVATLQSTTEIRTHYVDFTDDLPAGVTISSGTATHTPPSGTAVTCTCGAISSNIIPVTVPALSVTGRHIVTVTATLSSSDKSVARLIIPVQWDTIRAGMVDLILELRGMIDAGSNDYTVGGVPFWTDKQLQTALDRRRTDYKNEQLDPWTTYTGGTTFYYDYIIPWKWYESGTVFDVLDADGTKYGTALYSIDTARNMVVFVASTSGSVVAVNAHTFDLNRAAADLWRNKAAHYVLAYDFSTDNHNLKRSQMQQQCLQMAKFYDGMSGPTVAIIYRSDTDA